MNNKVLIIPVVIIIGLGIFFGGGYLLGVSQENKRLEPQIESLGKLADVSAALTSSKLITTIIAFGKVTSVSGRIVTLAARNESLQVSIKQDAKISSLVSPTATDGSVSGFPQEMAVEFKDIKVGDSLNINMKMLPDGQLEGSLVVIFPVAPIIQ